MKDLGNNPKLGEMVKFFNNILTAFLFGALILGMGGRIWMALSSLVITGTMSFSIGGTLEVILFGGLIGLFSGLVYLLLLRRRIKRRLFEGTFFGLMTFLVLSILPIEGREAIVAYEKVYWFPILLGFSNLFWLFGVATVYGMEKNKVALFFAKKSKT